MKRMLRIITIAIFAIAATPVDAALSSPRNTSDGYIISGSLGVAVSNTTTETTLAAINMQAGVMGDGKYCEFEMRGRITTPLLSAPTGTLRLKLGSTTLAVLSGISLALNLTNEPIKVWGRIQNDTASTQDVEVIIQQGGATPLLVTLPRMTTATWTVDTSSAQTLALTWQFGSAISGATFNADRFWMEVK